MIELKMGLDYTAHIMSFGLIAIAEAITHIRKDFVPPNKYDHFYQRYGVINEAIKRASIKLDMKLDDERMTQMIIMLDKSLEENWLDVLKGRVK